MATIMYLVFITYLAKIVSVFAINTQKDYGTANQVNIIEGIKNIVETTDPLVLDSVSGYLPDFKYELKNVTFIGLKECNATRLRVNKEKSTFDYNLECPHHIMYTKYFFIGRIANIWVEEEGDLVVSCGLYIFKFHGYYDQKLGDDNKEHVYIKFYHLDSDVKEKLTFEFSNLSYIADKEKSNAFHNLPDEYVQRELRAPVLNSMMNVYVKKLNDFLKVVPIEDVYKASY